MGSFAVQLAKAQGAWVAAMTSAHKLEQVQTLGADLTVGRHNEPALHSQGKFDLVIDTAGYRSFRDYRRLLTAAGTYVLVGGSMGRLLETAVMGAISGRFSGQRFTGFMAEPNCDDLRVVCALAADGRVKPLKGGIYPLEETAAALAVLESGAAVGKLVIAIGLGA